MVQNSLYELLTHTGATLMYDRSYFNTLYGIVFADIVDKRDRFTVTPVATLEVRGGVRGRRMRGMQYRYCNCQYTAIGGSERGVCMLL